MPFITIAKDNVKDKRRQQIVSELTARRPIAARRVSDVGITDIPKYTKRPVSPVSGYRSYFPCANDVAVHCH